MSLLTAADHRLLHLTSLYRSHRLTRLKQIAAALQTAILSATVTPTIVSGLNFSNENNDTIARLGA